MKKFLKHLFLEFKISIRDKSMIFMNYLFPLGFFFLIGSIMTKIHPEFKEQMIPAMILFTIMSSTLLTIPNAIVTARQSGIYRSYKIYGVNKFEIIGIITISTMIHIFISSVIIYFCAQKIFEAATPEKPLILIGICLLYALINIGISLLIGILSNNTRVTTLWAQLLFIPSIVVGGIMVPLTTLPNSLGNLTKILPSTYAMNSINVLAMDNTVATAVSETSLASGISVNESIIMLVTVLIISYLISLLLFRWDNKTKIKLKKA